MIKFNVNTVPQTPATSQDMALLMNQIADAVNQGRQAAYPWYYPFGAYGLAVDYFVYGADFLPLVSGGQDQRQIQIGGDAAFMITQAVLVETDTANTTFLAQRPLLFQLNDAGSGRYLSNQQIHADNWFGTAELPKDWPVPKIIAPTSTFTVVAQNLEAVDRNVRVAFHGFKIFQYTPGA